MVGESQSVAVVSARWLLAAILPAVFISTSAAVGLELSCYGLFALSHELRRRLWATIKRPVSLVLCLFALSIAFGTLHGIAPWGDRVSELLSWRKLFLFVLAAAVFDTKEAQRGFLRAFVWFCLAAAAASYLTFFTPITLHKMSGGIVLRDHAAQGMVFALGAAVALQTYRSWWDVVASVALAANVAFLTPGRVGYLVLGILALALIFSMRSPRAWAAAVASIALLLTSPLVHTRLTAGLEELRSERVSPELTSMGWRLVMWRNALELIAEQPILGVGTGSFEAAYRQRAQNESGWRSKPTNDPHNQYLRVWAEQGAIGLAAFVLFLLACYRELWPTALARPALIAWVLASLFASYFSRFAEGRLIFLWLGAMLAPAAQANALQLIRARFRHLLWPLKGFDTIPRGRIRTKYPIRHLRYWFMRMALENLHSRLGRPLRVLEVGIGGGDMLRFMGGPAEGENFSLPSIVERWDALDVQAEPGVLRRYSYSDFIEADIENGADLPQRTYDAIIVLHVLEHLREPEAALKRLLPLLSRGGLLVGGSPTMPTALARAHERWLHWKYRGVTDVRVHRHLSVLSPGRLRRFAQEHRLAVDLLAGAFLCRWTNVCFENSSCWPRANLLWGAAFPALGGEVYFVLRRHTCGAAQQRFPMPGVMIDQECECASCSEHEPCGLGSA